MAEITKEQYEKEKRLIGKLVSRKSLALRNAILEKVRNIGAKIKKEPLAATKKMTEFHKLLISLEQKLWKILEPRKIKETHSAQVQRVSKKRK